MRVAKSKIRPEMKQAESLKVTLASLEEKINAGQKLEPSEILWLEQRNQNGYLARYFQDRYERTSDPWDLVYASSYWREANDPYQSIEITNEIRVQNRKAMAALLTTRGGAFRDISRLDEAEACAKDALEHGKDNYHPYNLLGAIYYQRGRFEKGDEYYEKAKELGAPTDERVRIIKKLLRHFGQIERNKMISHLSKKDPELFQLTKRFI